MPIKLPTAIQNVTNKGKFVRTRWESTDKLAKDAIVTYAIVSADSLLGFVLLMMRVGILYFSPAQTSRSATLGLTPTVLFGLQTLSTSPPQIQQDMISTFSGEYPARWVPRESGEIIGNLITDDELCFGAPRKLLTLGEVFFASEQIALGEIPTSDWPIYCNFAWKVANYDSRGAIRRTGRRNAKRGLETHAPLRMETNSNREQKQLEIGRLLIEERLPIVNERCADLWAIAICDSSNATMAGLGLQIYQAASRLFQDLQTRERSVGE